MPPPIYYRKFCFFSSSFSYITCHGLEEDGTLSIFFCSTITTKNRFNYSPLSQMNQTRQGCRTLAKSWNVGSFVLHYESTTSHWGCHSCKQMSWQGVRKHQRSDYLEPVLDGSRYLRVGWPKGDCDPLPGMMVVVMISSSHWKWNIGQW